MGNKKISGLPAAGALTGAELVEAVQGGVNVQTTAQDIANLGGGGGGLDGHVIQDEGTPFTQRDILNFAGAGVTVSDDSGGGKTVVTIPGVGDAYVETEDVTGTTYDFVAGDHSKVKRFTNAAGCTATIPTGLTVGWLTNVYRGEGAGTLTIASAGSLESVGTQLTEEKTMATIFVRDTDIHVAVGAFESPIGNNYRGDWAGTTDLPATGGTYTAGVPGQGNRWRLTDTLVMSGNVFPPGTIIEAAINTPGQTLANWNFYQMQFIS